MMATNMICIFGATITILVENIPLICVGRFISGVATGGFSVFVPRFSKLICIDNFIIL